MPFDIKKAERVKRFIETYCTYSKGEWTGQKFHLLPWEWDDIIKPLFGTVNGDGYRQYRFCYTEIPKKNGKALDIETDIPTLHGWKKMRDIEVGDILFDENGLQCSVTFATEIMYGHECYEVIFSDGEKIIADAEHLWKTHNHEKTGRKNGLRRNKMSDNEKAGIYTTKHILKTLKVGKTQPANNHQIDCTRPLILPNKDLSIPPYTLGIWLGDGKNQNSQISSNDIDIIKNIKNEGFRVSKSKTKYEYWIHGLNPMLRKLNLFYNKHIPKEYLRASYNQRLLLLQGLMDSDGYCDKKGACEFTNTRKELVEGLIELLRTLGYKSNPIVEKIPTLNGKLCKKVYRVTFCGRKEIPPFRLKRKFERLLDNVKFASRRRRIKNIIPIDSVPVKCISVNSPSHLYLAGKGFIPTHNTEICAALGLYMLTNDGEDGAEVYLAAADREQAGLTYMAASAMVRNNEHLGRYLKCLDSRKRIIYHKKNSFMQVLSSESYTKHGLSPSCVIIDEIHAHPTDELWNVLTAGTDYARRQQIVFIITTAGVYDKNSIWWRLRTKAMQIRDRIVKDSRFLPVLYIADPEKDDPENEELWKRVNPSLNHIFTLEKIRQDYNEAKQNPIDFQNFKRFRLNIPIRQISKWMPMDAWDKCNNAVDMSSLTNRQCYGGIDLSLKLDLSSFVLVFEPDNDGIVDILCKFYCPEEGIIRRSKVDRVPYNIWEQQGFLKATPGETVDYAFIEKDMLDLIQRYKIQRIGFDPWKATATYNRIMEKLNPTNDDEGFQMVEIRQGAKSLHEPAQDMLANIMNGKVRHGGNPILRWNMDNMVMRSDANENLAPDKSKATERIDGGVALIMAWGQMIFNRSKSSAYDDLTSEEILQRMVG